MIAITLFMVGYGGHLCQALWHQSIAEFPGLSVGLTYMPIPIGGVDHAALHPRAAVGRARCPRRSIVFRDQPSAVE